MRAALETMLNMQHDMNSRVHPQWASQGFEWYRAAWIECAELMDHIGYKWWKQQTAEIEQVRLEIVDIWHFGLSDSFRGGDAIGEIARQIELDLYHAEPSGVDLKAATENLAAFCLVNKSFSVPLFAEVLFASGMSFEELYRRYVGKNVLNVFRQDNGYKTGNYKKLWQGREDNEHLAEVLADLTCADEQLPDAVYSGLSERYPRT